MKNFTSMSFNELLALADTLDICVEDKLNRQEILPVIIHTISRMIDNDLHLSYDELEEIERRVGA